MLKLILDVEISPFAGEIDLKIKRHVKGFSPQPRFGLAQVYFRGLGALDKILSLVLRMFLLNNAPEATATPAQLFAWLFVVNEYQILSYSFARNIPSVASAVPRRSLATSFTRSSTTHLIIFSREAAIN
jgi:hypothetical protein